MKYRIITYIVGLLTLFSACSTENDVASNNEFPVFPSDKDWVEEVMDGASATVTGFEPGDAVSRTSLVYDGQRLVFGWKNGDKLGLYPTAKDITNASEEQKQGLLPKETYPHPSILVEPNLFRVDPQVSQQSCFTCAETSSKTTKITNTNGSSGFFWDDVVRWSAYLPYKTQNEDKGENYLKRYFSFEGQTQKALPEIGEYFDYEDNLGNPTEHLNKYHLSEVAASEHLGEFDVMISPETKWEEGVRINFQMRHVGAVARLYLKVAEENLTINDVKLICDRKIFYENGSFTLFSHPYVNDEANNYGVDLDRINSTECQISPEGDPVNVLQLDFTETCKTKKTGSYSYGPYVVAYLMMYPITYDHTIDGNLFAYVTATDSEGKEVHFVSEPLADKTMESGKLYQWTSLTHPDDGLYPIELTATLLPWQDIVGAGIETDLEK